MSKRLQGHRTKLNANKMACDGRCSSRRKQPVFSSFSRTVQSSGVAWTWAATLTLYTKSGRLYCSTLAPRPRERHGRRQWTAATEERRKRVLTPSGLLVTKLKKVYWWDCQWFFFKSVNIWQSYNREHGYLVHFLPELGTRVRDSRLESVSSLCFWDLRLTCDLPLKTWDLTCDSSTKTWDLLETRP